MTSEPVLMYSVSIFAGMVEVTMHRVRTRFRSTRKT